MRLIRATFALGMDGRYDAVDPSWLPQADWDTLPFLKDKQEKMLHEIGTLGGGNHFIEIQKDTVNDNVWVMLHSGSRNIGHKVADFYDKLAQTWCQRWYADFLPGLAFFPIETKMAKDYMNEMKYCMRLACANREKMMTEIRTAISTVFPQTQFDEVINIAHNYAAWENHFGEDVIVHRKGATSARAGEIGIIPGSMGSKSYIVQGLGNPESFMSCSHGAGRRLARQVARQTLSLKDECKKMDDMGIIHGMRASGRDEAPGAYKDIETVMANESDLVTPLVELQPLAVIKG